MYDLYQFQALAVEWVHPIYNHGPFILMHGDLRPSNIIVDKDMTIVSIIDWEWSRIVPAQLFVPPTWLTGRELAGTRSYSYFAQKDYIAELVKLRDVVAIRESQLPTTLSGPPLSKIWSELEVDNSFLIAAGILFLTTIHTTYSNVLITATMAAVFTTMIERSHSSKPSGSCEGWSRRQLRIVRRTWKIYGSMA